MKTDGSEQDAEAPCIDFDVTARFADYHMIALMCWPDKNMRKARLAKLGIYARGHYERPYLDFIERVIAASGGGVPEAGTLDNLIQETSSDFTHRAFLSDWVRRWSGSYRPWSESGFLSSVAFDEFKRNARTGRSKARTFEHPDFGSVGRVGTVATNKHKSTNPPGSVTIGNTPSSHPFSLATRALYSLEVRFWAWVADPKVRVKLISSPHLLFDPYEDRLTIESGGSAAAAKAPSIDAIVEEFQENLLGYPMLAGLVLILIQTFKAHYWKLDEFHRPEIEASLTSACRTIIGVNVVPGKCNELKKYWPKVCFVAPLWAALLIESGCLSSGSLIDTARLEAEFTNVMLSDERRVRLLSLAKPFCDLLRDHKDRRPLTPRPERIIRLPETVKPMPVLLPKLTGKALEAALLRISKKDA